MPDVVASDRYCPLNCGIVTGECSSHSSFQPIEISLDIALETSQRLFTIITIQSCLSKIYFDIYYNMEHVYDIHTLIKTDFACLPDIVIERLLTHVSFLGT